jgi:TonB-dependent SusC/RagA subfamily outer membrane receptor
VVKEGPGWNPGKQRGRAVNVRTIVPIAFGVDIPAKETSVQGVIKDESGQAIAGCTVIIKDTNNGTITNSQGNFKLELPLSNKARELVISAPGFESQTHPTRNGTVHVVKLKKAQGMGSTDDAIEIKASGEDLFGLEKNPLYIVDGIEVENFKHTSINPYDIESISVLKDSSAVKTYGEKAKNGVVIITSKNASSSGSDLLKLQQNQGQSYNSMPSSENSKISETPNLRLSMSMGLASDSNEEKELVRGLSIDKDETPLIFIDGEEVPYDEIKEIDPNSIEHIEVLKDKSALDNYGEKGRNGVLKIQTRSNVEKMKDLAQNLDQLPEYKNGMNAFDQAIQEHIKYPLDARKHNVQGEVFVSFTISKEGNLEDIKTEEAEYLALKEIVVVGYSKSEEEPSSLKNIPVLAEEVIRVLKQMDNFKPGIQDGQPVDVRMTLPVTFKLQ